MCITFAFHEFVTVIVICVQVHEPSMLNEVHDSRPTPPSPIPSLPVIYSSERSSWWLVYRTAGPTAGLAAAAVPYWQLLSARKLAMAEPDSDLSLPAATHHQHQGLGELHGSLAAGFQECWGVVVIIRL